MDLKLINMGGKGSMLDIKIIRNDPEMVKKAMKNRNADLDSVIDEILDIDKKRRTIISETESMKANQNAFNKKIPAII